MIRQAILFLLMSSFVGCVKPKALELSGCSESELQMQNITQLGEATSGNSFFKVAKCVQPGKEAEYDCVYRGVNGPSCNLRSQKFEIGRYANYSGKGTAIVTGQAFARTKGGDVKLAAGETIVLFPQTTYFEEMLKSVLIGILRYTSEDARSIVRKSQVDAQGNFRFDALPEGNYYLFVNISWETGNGKTGGYFFGGVKAVRDTETKAFLVSGELPPGYPEPTTAQTLPAPIGTPISQPTSSVPPSINVE